MMENRIIELEIKIAYQEDLVQTLNAIVAQQQLKIDDLESTCRWLSERLISLSEESRPSDTVFEKPPHY